MFQIKICGITSLKDAQLAILAGADAVGLNFCDQSERRVDPEMEARIADFLEMRATKVGVFVNAAPAAIEQTAERLHLDQIQLHGDEPPEMCGQLAGRSILRAFRLGNNGFAAISEYLEQCQAIRKPDAVLIDAYQAGKYGGTGRVVDWQSLARSVDAFRGLPLVLAGGLTPFNVAEAIAIVRPAAVDTASGVESATGRKDPILVRAFVQAAKKAFAQLAEHD